MDVKQQRKKALAEKNHMLSLFNPLDRTLVFKFAGEEYELPSMEISRFKKAIGELFRKKLITEVLNSKNIGYPREKDYKEAEEEVDVKI